MKINKIILSNKQALSEKYGKNLKLIEAAIKKMIAADKKRGIQTKLIYFDQSSSMKTYHAPVVKVSENASQVKKAIDALFKKINPEYIMILGAPDIVPHVDLINMIKGNDDDEVPSDLPYACDAPYSTRIADFLAPTRVVGRLPDIVAVPDHKYIIDLIQRAAAWKSTTAAHYKDYFALTAKAWQGSTSESLDNMFGNHDALLTVPKSASPYTVSALNNRVHFYNCHGGDLDVGFYGEPGHFPTAISSNDLDGKISEGTVVAAECCYGGQLFDPEMSNGIICFGNNYLKQGALAVMASTTAAYGPADGQGLADLITQFFIRNIQKGASSGRAFLDAQLRFMDKAAPRVTPVELKTMAQFILLGDPSVHLIEAKETTSIKSAQGTLAAREDRRVKLKAWGDSLQRVCKKPVASTNKKNTREMNVELSRNHFTKASAHHYHFGKAANAASKGLPEETISIFIEPATNRNKLGGRMLCVRERGKQVIDSSVYFRK